MMDKDTFPPCLPSSLANAIRQAKVISFDIFDTALIRVTEKPIDVFALLAHEAGIQDAQSFTVSRIQAEASARHLAWENRQAVEVTLPEIYACLADYPQFCDLSVAELMQRERALELHLCRSHPVMSAAFSWAAQLNKKVGFISDMYLDKPLIEAMLIKCGYKKFDFLLLSSEAGTTKANGGLYRQVLERLSIPPLDILHIGDNLNSDIKQAREAGLNTFYTSKIADHFPESPLGRRFARQKIVPINFSQPTSIAEDNSQDTWKSLWRGLVVAYQAKTNNDDFWYSLGYTHIGMLLLGFVFWLDQRARDEQVTQLYFLARDGHIMQTAHQLLRDRNLAFCQGRYLYASRRALNIPALTEINEKTSDFLVSGTTRMPVGAFLSRIGLSVPQSLPMILAAGFSGSDQMVLSGEDYGRLRSLFQALAPDLLRLAEAERGLLYEYLQQEDVFNQPHIGLVDIGWHGSLQESFCNLLSLSNRKNKVTGFYLGTFSAVIDRIAAGARQHAYLCAGGEPVNQLTTIRASAEIFEWIFCAQHGSVLGFQRSPTNKIEPILESSDLETLRQHTAAKMQEGALQFIQDALACFQPGTLPPPISANLAISLVRDLLYNPTAQEAKSLGNLPHAEGFGDVARVLSIACPESKPYNIFLWHKLAKGYRASFWRKGYKRRLWPDCW